MASSARCSSSTSSPSPIHENIRRSSRSSTIFSCDETRPPSSQPAACITMSLPAMNVAHSDIDVSYAAWASTAFDEQSPPPPRNGSP